VKVENYFVSWLPLRVNLNRAPLVIEVQPLGFFLDPLPLSEDSVVEEQAGNLRGSRSLD